MIKISAKTLIKSKDNTIKNIMDDNSKYIIMGTNSLKGNLNKTDEYAIVFRKGEYITDLDNTQKALSNTFSIDFFARFESKSLTLDDPNKFIFKLDKTKDGNNNNGFEYNLTSEEIDLTDYNHYSIIRYKDNSIVFRINGTTRHTFTSDAVLDFNNNSYLYIGNNIRTLTGYDVTLDNLTITSGILHELDFNVEDITEYKQVNDLRQKIYIVDGKAYKFTEYNKESTGE